MNWESVIGLEIHAQLKTRSKIFSGAPNDFGAEPNRNACAIDLGLPGVLPVLNEAVIRMAILFGLAIDARIAETCIFARKNYFYPDLPKGYQISQYEHPIVVGGEVEIEGDDGEALRIGVTRAHLEEDAGKSVHDQFGDATGIDLNRAGTPLIEIVSEPDLRSARQAVAYMRKIHTIVKYLGICDGNMQEGSFRCDANVSVRPAGTTNLGTRAEVKNLNSFRFVERAITFEIERQIELLESGGTVVQETRLYDSERDETRSMRGKEEANDYRYFPDPDLLPVHIDPDRVTELANELPELPDRKLDRFVSSFGLQSGEARALVENRALAEYFEQLATLSGDARGAHNWILGPVSAALNREGVPIEACPVSTQSLADLMRLVADGTLSGTMAREVFDAMWAGEGSARAIVEARGLEQMSDAATIEPIVDRIIAEHPEQVEQYRAGKQKVFAFFVGQVMKATRGKANPQQVTTTLKQKLSRG